MSEKPKSEKEELAEQAEEMVVAAMATGIEGDMDIAEVAETLDLASEVAAAGAVELAEGASDLTRAVDMEVVADRVAQLSDVVAEAGITDVLEGAEMLATSEDVNVLSAMVGLMGAEAWSRVSPHGWRDVGCRRCFRSDADACNRSFPRRTWHPTARDGCRPDLTRGQHPQFSGSYGRNWSTNRCNGCA
jgi:hypothetical protein